MLIMLQRISTDALLYIQSYQHRRTHGYSNSLHKMLVSNRKASASDPRDKIYALLQLSHERREADLRPDYTLSVERVYTQLATTWINRVQPLACLGSAGLVRDHALPSWVPDWSVRSDRLPTLFSVGPVDGDMRSKGLYNACAGLPLDAGHSYMSQQLNVRGIRFDKIAAVSRPHCYFS